MIVSMIEKLQETSSTTAKIDVLRDYCILQGIRDILYYTYNPFYNYGISKKRLEEIGIPPIRDRCLNKEETAILTNLIRGKLTGGNAIDVVVSAMAEYGGLIGRIITKDLRCGISATSINKVCPKLIPKFEVQLAKEVPESKWKFPAHMQIKYDGVRLLAFVDSAGTAFRTRNGKGVKLPFLANLFSGLPEGVYDGEIVIAEGKLENRTSISGMINSAMHGGRIDESNLVFYCFDYLSKESFSSCYCLVAEQSRFEAAKQIIESEPAVYPNIQLAETVTVNNARDVNMHYARMLTEGYEGVILKPLKGKYEFKRSANWIKLKETKSADLLCIGIEEGTGKYDGQIGALVLSGIVDGKQIEVSAGSGLDDRDRSRPASYFTGKTIEVLYNSVIPRRGRDSMFTLFLPRYRRVRFDKEAA